MIAHRRQLTLLIHQCIQFRLLVIQPTLKLTQLIMNNTVRHLLNAAVFNNSHPLLMTGLATVLLQPFLRQAIKGSDKQLVQGG